MATVSSAAGSFYRPDETVAGSSTVTASIHPAGPWSADAQHDGPPMALMAREAQRLGDGSRVVARVTCDLLGPLPVAQLRVSAAWPDPDGPSSSSSASWSTRPRRVRSRGLRCGWCRATTRDRWRGCRHPRPGLPAGSNTVCRGAGTRATSTPSSGPDLVREPGGEWIGLRAHTTLGRGAAGLAMAEVFDEEGFVGRTPHALLVRAAR